MAKETTPPPTGEDARERKRPRLDRDAGGDTVAETAKANMEPGEAAAERGGVKYRGGRYVGSIDQGTTSTRFIIFNDRGEPVASHQITFENLYPHPGWHEHDPLELVSTVEECIDKAMAQFVAQGRSAADVRCVGIANQRETTVVWDWETGEPLHQAVVWPDTRTASLVRELRTREGADALRELCGLPLSTYPSSVKLVWLLRNIDAVRRAYDANRLAFGTVDSWLLYRLNGGAARSAGPLHATDPTNASRTMFMDLRTRSYHDRLLGFFDLDPSKLRLPQIAPSSDPSAFGALASGPLRGVPITGCLGDQSAAVVGQLAFSPGQAKNTYGTGCFLLYNVGPEPVASSSGLLATVAYDLGPALPPAYALEGSIAVAGAGVKFLVQNLGMAVSSADVSALAESVPDSGGVVFVTAFSGLFAPYWIDDAKGTLFGLTQHTQKAHIARATLEATCFQTRAILDAMARDSGQPLASLAVDGGLSNSNICMQTQADVAGIRVVRPAMRETTSLGAAIAAGLALGLWSSPEHLRSCFARADDATVFEPRLDSDRRNAMFHRWEHAVKMSRGWVS